MFTDVSMYRQSYEYQILFTATGDCKMNKFSRRPNIDLACLNVNRKGNSSNLI